jgi:pyruvate dehydrogenase E1 component alpha subunit
MPQIPTKMKEKMGYRELPQNAVPGPDAAETESGFSLVSNRKLEEIYAAMLRMRILAARSGSNTGGAKLPAGREAIVASVTIDLLPDDTVLVSPQDLLPGFLRGVPLQAILTGQCNGHPCFLAPQAGAAARFNLGLNAALAGKVNGNNNIAVVFAEAREAVSVPAREALTFATAQQLPLILVCDSMAEAGRSRAASAADRATAWGAPGIAVDGNDAVAVYRVACESISRARKGRGPTLIDCRSFRIHTPLATSSAKPANARKAASQDDPIAQMEKYLANKGIFRTEQKASIGDGFIQHLDFILAEERQVAAL